MGRKCYANFGINCVNSCLLCSKYCQEKYTGNNLFCVGNGWKNVSPAPHGYFFQRLTESMQIIKIAILANSMQHICTKKC